MTPPVLPHSLEAEESVIGTILVHSRKLSEVVPLVRVEDFYHPALRAIYEAMLELDAESKPVDALTVAELMRAQGTFDKLLAFDGSGYLTDLMAKVVTVENIAYHARIIREKASRRIWAETFRELAAAAYADSDDEDYFSLAGRRMLELATARNREGDGPRLLREVMSDYQNELSERVRRNMEGASIVGITTGFGDLDRLLCGLHEGQQIVIAARPMAGKSAFVSNVLTNAARVVIPGTTFHPHPALLFSLEMSDEQLAERMVSGQAGIDSQRLRQGEIRPEMWKDIGRSIGNLADLPIRIEDRGTITLAEIRALTRTWLMGLPPCPTHKLNGCRECTRPIVAIDYLHLVTAEERRGSSREQDVSVISRSLKLMAKDLRIPVISLSQLNRSLELRPNKRPMLSDLRESGAIENDADVVVFIYRDEMYHEVDGCGSACERCAMRGTAEVIVAKQRMGPCATVVLAFLKAYTRFESLSPRRAER
jgi:replicative DNA helicase